jgi:hypothetical protein
LSKPFEAKEFEDDSPGFKDFDLCTEGDSSKGPMIKSSLKLLDLVNVVDFVGKYKPLGDFD